MYHELAYVRAGLGAVVRSSPLIPRGLRTSLLALHFAGVRLGFYNPSPDPTLEPLYTGSVLHELAYVLVNNHVSQVKIWGFKTNNMKNMEFDRPIIRC